ncbi:uncharacterized protein P884DRAFT_261210 [Thermothelomyces heterothallicus CBS 202.75]|uniref:uncharacterized protein n=1 Tax=Thermothelomyces heterothallicus CBS 202.75 TaxID=1149848 RepID=UPI0037441B88
MESPAWAGGDSPPWGAIPVDHLRWYGRPLRLPSTYVVPGQSPNMAESTRTTYYVNRQATEIPSVEAKSRCRLCEP